MTSPIIGTDRSPAAVSHAYSNRRPAHVGGEPAKAEGGKSDTIAAKSDPQAAANKAAKKPQHSEETYFRPDFHTAAFGLDREELNALAELSKSKASYAAAHAKTQAAQKKYDDLLKKTGASAEQKSEAAKTLFESMALEEDFSHNRTCDALNVYTIAASNNDVTKFEINAKFKQYENFVREQNDLNDDLKRFAFVATDHAREAGRASVPVTTAPPREEPAAAEAGKKFSTAEIAAAAIIPIVAGTAGVTAAYLLEESQKKKLKQQNAGLVAQINDLSGSDGAAGS